LAIKISELGFQQTSMPRDVVSVGAVIEQVFHRSSSSSFRTILGVVVRSKSSGKVVRRTF
jgi:hypothetical protein